MSKTKPRRKSVTVAEVKALIRQCLKEEKKLGIVQEGDELLEGYGKTSKRLQKLIFQKHLAEFWAKHFGVDLERFTKWRDYIRLNEPRSDDYAHSRRLCSVIKKSAKRCTKKLSDKYIVPLEEFYAGITDCCSQHRREYTHDEQVENTMRIWEMTRENAEKFLVLPKAERHAIMEKTLNSLAEKIRGILKR